jgi:hypothetical protein
MRSRSPSSRRLLADQGEQLSPVWREFIRFCRDLRHGEIERLSIQDGTPVLAEMIKRKVTFNPEVQTD